MFSTMDFFFFQAEDGIRDKLVTGVQTCALPISHLPLRLLARGGHDHFVERIGREHERQVGGGSFVRRYSHTLAPGGGADEGGPHPDLSGWDGGGGGPPPPPGSGGEGPPRPGAGA